MIKHSYCKEDTYSKYPHLEENLPILEMTSDTPTKYVIQAASGQHCVKALEHQATNIAIENAVTDEQVIIGWKGDVFTVKHGCHCNFCFIDITKEDGIVQCNSDCCNLQWTVVEISEEMYHLLLPIPFFVRCAHHV